MWTSITAATSSTSPRRSDGQASFPIPISACPSIAIGRRSRPMGQGVICLVMSGGTYYLCDSTNTIFKAGSDRLSNIYSKVNSMSTTLTNIGTKLDTLHADNSL